ncbi:MAG: hypothetical protein IIA03_05435, partial [Proteobacteria bacterium]|nr:hypothetical protein [Pseudomonadota bacterium]
TPPAVLAGALTPLPAAAFTEAVAEASLLGHFGAASLEALGLAGRRLSASAAGALIGYLRENQPAVLGHVSRVSPERPGRFMSLDASTVRNLEIFEPLRPGSEGVRRAPGAGRERTLLGVLDLTKTAMGARLLRRWLGQPLLDCGEIGERQDGVAFFESSAVRRGRTAEVLAGIGDVERSLTRVSSAAASSPVATTPRDLVSLRRGLESLPLLRELIGDCAIEDLPIAYTAVATDMHSREEVWLREGQMFDAIRASIATPLVFTPFRHGRRTLLDGALVNPVPIGPTLEAGNDLTVIVDLSGPAQPQPTAATSEALPGSNRYKQRIGRFIDSLQRPRGGPPRPQPPRPAEPGLLDVAFVSMQAMQDTISKLRLSAYAPDVQIDIPGNACGFFEFWRAEELIELGRERTAQAFERLGR